LLQEGHFSKFLSLTVVSINQNDCGLNNELRSRIKSCIVGEKSVGVLPGILNKIFVCTGSVAKQVDKIPVIVKIIQKLEA
jgi:hypothetical protein